MKFRILFVYERQPIALINQSKLNRNKFKTLKAIKSKIKFFVIFAFIAAIIVLMVVAAPAADPQGPRPITVTCVGNLS